MAKAATVTNLKDVSNSAESVYQASIPYSVRVSVEGVADFLYHRWNVEAVEAKANAAKNSAAKKTDDIESYVWRLETGELCIPGDHLRGAIVLAAKFRQDPRSPRKSAMDLFKAGVVVTTNLAPVGKMTWDYLDKRRVTVQRQGINRNRPALLKGWQATFDIMVVLPEYIDRNMLREVIEQAGRLCGLGDYHPTYGRFGITSYQDLVI